MLDTARLDAILAESFSAVDGSEGSVEGCEVIDLLIVRLVPKIDKIHGHAAEVIELLKEWPGRHWSHPTPPLGEEISYLVAGNVLGNDHCAFRLFAFGKVLNWWDILDPYTEIRAELDYQDAHHFATLGMVAIKGYRPKTTT